jgi:hypothetical protein
MKRHADGTWRNPNKATTVSDRVRRARWVETETLHLKRMGVSFDTIAQHITRVGRGETQALTATPEGLTFPPAFSISRQACHRAFQTAMAREPSLEVAEMRKIDTERCEEIYMNLQPALRKGQPTAVLAGMKVLGHKARINGYAAPQRVELTGRDGAAVPVSLGLSDETVEAIYQRLTAGVLGNPRTQQESTMPDPSKSGLKN